MVGRARASCSPPRSACACGASSRACPTPTTPTRTRTSSRTRSASSATAGTRTTSSTRRPTRTCCTSSSTSGSAGARACRHAFATNPTEVFVVARVTAAVRRHARGVAAVPGRRAALRPRASACWPRRCWRVAFLPSSTRTWRSTTCRRWRRSPSRCGAPPGCCARDACATTLLAGVGLGLACATKYTGGIVLLPLRGGRRDPAGGRRPGAARRRAGSCWRAIVALGAFVVANPYARARPRGLPRRAAATRPTPPTTRWASSGLTQSSGHALLPVDVHLGAGLGAARWRRVGRRSACSPSTTGALLLVLGPAPILFVLFMGTQARFFGRWLLPVFPIACLLARLRDRAARRSSPRRRAPALGPRARGRWAPCCCCGQGHRLLAAQRDDAARAPTRATRRAQWLVDHVPASTKIVVEPVVPDAWAQRRRAPEPRHRQRRRAGRSSRRSRSNIADDGSLLPGAGARSSTSRTTSARSIPG